MTSTVKSSVIIPYCSRGNHPEHCNRAAYLRLCLQSLSASAKHCEIANGSWEIVVCGDSLSLTGDGRWINCETSPPFLKLRPNEPPPFWKNHLLNVGIEESSGEVLTFLDGDDIVPPDFFARTDRLFEQNLTFLSWRIRKIGYEEAATTPLEALFARYDEKRPDSNGCVKSRYRRAYEAYETPDNDTKPGQEPTDQAVFGNSQISIRRKTLGSFRMDERYWGRSFEDLSMLRDIWNLHRNNFRTAIVTDPGIFTITHPYSPGFNNDRWADRNRRRYAGEKVLWALADDNRTRQSFLVFLLDWVKYFPDTTIRCLLRRNFDPQEAGENDCTLDLKSTFFIPQKVIYDYPKN